jgi:guanylate kinase
VSIFVKPPSIEVLRKRLIERSDMSENEIEKRIEEAKNELTKSKYFNHMVVNEDFDDCLHDIRRILMSL